MSTNADSLTAFDLDFLQRMLATDWVRVVIHPETVRRFDN